MAQISGRYVFDGSAISNLNFGIFKNFPIKEISGCNSGPRLFNVANHPNFAGPNTSKVAKVAQRVATMVARVYNAKDAGGGCEPKREISSRRR
jgi:hypothetical protein